MVVHSLKQWVVICEVMGVGVVDLKPGRLAVGWVRHIEGILDRLMAIQVTYVQQHK